MSERPEPRIIRPWAAEGDNWEVIETTFDADAYRREHPDGLTAEEVAACIRARYAPETGEQQR